MSQNCPAGEILHRGDWVKVTHRIGGHRGGSDFLRLEDGRGYIYIQSRILDLTENTRVEAIVGHEPRIL